jgi:UDP-2-acetamido-3-amino-2,3-dideoxy-glucuronate N-acetyltransferase
MSATGIAVVGAGTWGSNHVRTWHELGCLHRVVDPDRARRERVRASYPGVAVSAQLSPVLRDPLVHAVVLATPAPTHARLAERCLGAGKHVLVEKPLALSRADGERVVRIARKRSLLLMVGHVMEYHPAVRRLQSLIELGELGRVEYIYSHRLNLGRIRTEESALWSFAPHDVAIMLRLVRRMPSSLSCNGGGYLNQEVADVTLTHLRFDGGLQAHIFVSWLHPFKEHRFVVVGDRQMAVFDDTAPWPEKLVLYPHRVDWTSGQVPVAFRGDAIPVELRPAEPLRAECEHFLKCIEDGQEPETNGENALRVLTVLEAAHESLREDGAAKRVRAPGPAAVLRRKGSATAAAVESGLRHRR